MKIFGNLFLASIIFFTNCNTTEPPPEDTRKLTLKFEDASCIEAWINVTTEKLQLPAAINIFIKDSLSQVSILNTKDSLIYIDSLLPNQTYKLLASSIQHPISSNELTVTTMDTTSHNFTFETWTFGDIGSSVLFDVAIISEDNIWCVGEINIADTSVNGYTTYNAVHWDGSEWQLKRITVNFRGNLITPPLEGIFAYSSTDIWFVGSLPIHGNGENWVIYDLRTTVDPNISVSKAWGTNSNDIYFVGRNGSIARKNGSKWTRIESGTTLNLLDIHGNENGDIYVSGGNLSTGEGIVLKINSNNTITKIIDSYFYGSGFDSTKMFTENLYGPLTGIWVNNNGTVYTVGNLIYRYNLGLWDYAKGIEYNYLGAGFFSGRGFSWGVMGKGNNDFIFIGERNTIRHVNGIDAEQLGESFSYDSEYHWYGIDYKQNTAVAAGRKGGYAAVLVFKR